MKRAILIGCICTVFMFTSCNSKPASTEVENKPETTAAAVNDTDNQDKPETSSSNRRTISTAGQVLANNVKSIAIDFPAGVETVMVKEGQKVKAGDVLMSLNLKEFEAQIADREQELRSQENNITRIKTTYLSGNSSPEMRKLANDLQTAQDSYNRGIKELTTKQQLFEAGSVSKYDLEEFKRTVEDRQNAITAIQLSIDNLKATKQSEAEALSASTAKISTEIKNLKDRLNKPYLRNNQIISDVKNGAAFEIGCTDGDIISGSKKILSILDLDSLFVRTEIAEKSIKDIKVGAEAVITPRSDNTRQYKGKVTRISSVPSLREGEAFTPIEISIDNRDDFLLPYYIVDIKIELAQKK